MLNSFYTAWVSNICLDSPTPWGLGLQDGSSPLFFGIVELHNEILYYLILIIGGVGWLMISLVSNFSKNKLSYKYNNHGTILELIWTLTPALILMLIAAPSFRLLFTMDEIINPNITIKAIGAQWYWKYELTDYISNGSDIEFDSFMVNTEDLELGQLRLLEVDSHLIIPNDTDIRLIVTSQDVIHSFAVPSLGLKVDCIPGRLNQLSLYSEREGTYHGQCSELCGFSHGFMPIVIESVNIEKYFEFINSFNEN